MRIFVTGGTGLLGNTILRQLASVERIGSAAQQSIQSLALIRHDPGSEVFQGTDCEFVSADLGSGQQHDRDAVYSAIQQSDAVIHSAGLIHLGWKRLEESLAVNRDGTRLIADACSKFGVPLVHIGTVNTLAVGSREKAADEETPIDSLGGQVECSYVVSKRAGVDEVLSATEHRNLSSVILHPGFMLGPWDWKPSSGRMIVEVAKAWRPLSPAGGNSLCDSRDVASATITAMDLLMQKKIEPGRQYILAGENWTFFEMWKEFARRTNRRGPIMPAGPGQRWAGKIAAQLIDLFGNQEHDLNTAALGMSNQFHWYDSSRAKNELGYRWRDPSESIDDAIEWLVNHGKLSNISPL